MAKQTQDRLGLELDVVEENRLDGGTQDEESMDRMLQQQPQTNKDIEISKNLMKAKNDSLSTMV